jgi:lantibiotic modifying enzyme
LLELYAVTGRGEFLEGGRAAFAYEDGLFNPAAANWPDLRSPGPAGGGTPAPQYAAGWCHGAPGIGLARLRALALDPGSRAEYVATARTALGTTMRTLDATARLPRADASLCHGLAGLAETLLTAGRWLDDEGYQDAARTAAAGLIAKYGVLGDWPSGVPSWGPNPSLMLGTAGIGYHFLRQYDPHRVPPVLVVVA